MDGWIVRYTDRSIARYIDIQVVSQIYGQIDSHQSDIRIHRQSDTQIDRQIVSQIYGQIDSHQSDIQNQIVRESDKQIGIQLDTQIDTLIDREQSYRQLHKQKNINITSDIQIDRKSDTQIDSQLYIWRDQQSDIWIRNLESSYFLSRCEYIERKTPSKNIL